MSRKSKREIWAVDCETDPFLHDRVPVPFIWGAYNGEDFLTFDDTETFVNWFADKNAWIYAHNGGKFDFIFLLPFLMKYTDQEILKCKIINGRMAELPFGKAKLRDSWSIIPTPLADFQKTEIDYGKLEADVRANHMREIVAYLRDDCVNLFEMVMTFRENAGTGMTIAGNALNFAKNKLDITVGRTNRKFDKKFRPFYYGGRCEAFKIGEFKDISIFDIKSAYPFAMTHKHATGTDYVDRAEIFHKMSDERLNTCFIDVTCLSSGAFPIRSKGDLSFPHEKLRYLVTGWEFVAARELGLISDIEVHHCYEFYDEISFEDYVEHWFTEKEKAEKAGEKALRHVCKIMLNSLYGKLCQNPIRYKDYKIVEALTPLEEGWNLAYTGTDYEIHARSSLYDLFQKYGEDWENFSLYYNVATGASITGFTRAHLLRTIFSVGYENALYCDTDSLVCYRKSGHGKLDRGERLGQWGLEGHGSVVYIAGRKLYAARLRTGKRTFEKTASKGVRLSFAEIKKVALGKEIEYKNPAPTFKLDGSATFITRKIKRTG